MSSASHLCHDERTNDATHRTAENRHPTHHVCVSHSTRAWSLVNPKQPYPQTAGRERSEKKTIGHAPRGGMVSQDNLWGNQGVCIANFRRHARFATISVGSLISNTDSVVQQTRFVLSHRNYIKREFPPPLSFICAASRNPHSVLQVFRTKSFLFFFYILPIPFGSLCPTLDNRLSSFSCPPGNNPSNSQNPLRAKSNLPLDVGDIVKCLFPPSHPQPHPRPATAKMDSLSSRRRRTSSKRPSLKINTMPSSKTTTKSSLKSKLISINGPWAITKVFFSLTAHLETYIRNAGIWIAVILFIVWERYRVSVLLQ